MKSVSLWLVLAALVPASNIRADVAAVRDLSVPLQTVAEFLSCQARTGLSAQIGSLGDQAARDPARALDALLNTAAGASIGLNEDQIKTAKGLTVLLTYPELTPSVKGLMDKESFSQWRSINKTIHDSESAAQRLGAMRALSRGENAGDIVGFKSRWDKFFENYRPIGGLGDSVYVGGFQRKSYVALKKPETKKSIGMSEFIGNGEVGDYDALEKYHGGWRESMEFMKRLLSKRRKGPKRPLRIFEHGAGSGNSTRILAEIPHAKIAAVEIDAKYYKKLTDNFKGSRKVLPVLGDSLLYGPDQKQDAVVAMFSLTHLDKRQMMKFLKRARTELLREDGILLVGDEFLRAHDPQDEKNALMEHHANVIAKATDDGLPKLAHLELDAYYSGYHEIGDFKVSLEEFQRRLETAGFRWRSYHIFPKADDRVPFPNSGGVYVYAATPRK